MLIFLLSKMPRLDTNDNSDTRPSTTKEDSESDFEEIQAGIVIISAKLNDSSSEKIMLGMGKSCDPFPVIDRLKHH